MTNTTPIFNRRAMLRCNITITGVAAVQMDGTTRPVDMLGCQVQSSLFSPTQTWAYTSPTTYSNSPLQGIGTQTVYKSPYLFLSISLTHTHATTFHVTLVFIN
jgi:hypothetical protein